MRSASTRREVSGASATTAGGAPDWGQVSRTTGRLRSASSSSVCPSATISPGRAPTRVTTPPIGATIGRASDTWPSTAPAATRAPSSGQREDSAPVRRPATGARITAVRSGSATTSPATRSSSPRSARASAARPIPTRATSALSSTTRASPSSSLTRLGATIGASLRSPRAPSRSGRRRMPAATAARAKRTRTIPKRRLIGWGAPPADRARVWSGRRASRPSRPRGRCPRTASRRCGGPPAALGACQEQLRPRGLEPGGLAPLVAGAVALHQGARGHDLGIGGDHAETGAATTRHRRLDLRHDGVLGLGHPRGRDGSRGLGLVQRAALAQAQERRKSEGERPAMHALIPDETRTDREVGIQAGDLEPHVRLGDRIGGERRHDLRPPSQRQHDQGISADRVDSGAAGRPRGRRLQTVECGHGHGQRSREVGPRRAQLLLRAGELGPRILDVGPRSGRDPTRPAPPRRSAAPPAPRSARGPSRRPLDRPRRRGRRRAPARPRASGLRAPPRGPPAGSRRRSRGPVPPGAGRHACPRAPPSPARRD